MKYNININQLALAKSGLDVVDAALLDYICAICASKSQLIQNQRIVHTGSWFTWIGYQKIIDDMPLLGILTKSGISKRLEKLEKKGFIKKVIQEQRTYVAVTEKIDGLLFLTGNGTVSARKHPRFLQETNNNISNNTIITIASPTENASSKKEEPAEPFSLKKEISKMEENKRRDVNIIAFYATERFKSLSSKVTNKKQLNLFIKRHLIAAGKLKEYTDDQIVAATEQVKVKYRDVDWTLDTVFKELTK